MFMQRSMIDCLDHCSMYKLLRARMQHTFTHVHTYSQFCTHIHICTHMQDVRPLLMAVTGSAAVEADARPLRLTRANVSVCCPRSAEARDGSLSFAHAAHLNCIYFK